MKYHGWLRRQDLPLSISYLEELGLTALTTFRMLIITITIIIKGFRKQRRPFSCVQQLVRTGTMRTPTAVHTLLPAVSLCGKTHRRGRGTKQERRIIRATNPLLEVNHKFSLSLSLEKLHPICFNL